MITFKICKKSNGKIWKAVQINFTLVSVLNLLSKNEWFLNLYTRLSPHWISFPNFPKITFFGGKVFSWKMKITDQDFLLWNIDNRSCEQNDRLKSLFESFFGNTGFLKKVIENWAFLFFGPFSFEPRCICLVMCEQHKYRSSVRHNRNFGFILISWCDKNHRMGSLNLRFLTLACRKKPVLSYLPINYFGIYEISRVHTLFWIITALNWTWTYSITMFLWLKVVCVLYSV